MMKALPGNDQENQYYFAIKNERRKKYVENGSLEIDVYYVFYPREEIISAQFN